MTATQEFIGCGAMDVTKPCKFIWFGEIHGPKPYEFIRSRATIISHTPVITALDVAILKLSRLESGRNPARKPDFRPGSTIA